MSIQLKSAFATCMVTSALLAPSLAHAALVISNKPTRNVTCNQSAQCIVTSPSAVFNVGDLAALLAQYSVSVDAFPAKEIVVDAPLSWTSSSELYLATSAAIIVNKPVAVAGTGALSIYAHDLKFASKGGIDFWSLSSSLMINYQTYTLVGDIKTLAADIRKNPSGNYALAKDYDASPDGMYAGIAIGTDFHGVLEGLGHAVSNLSFQLNDTTSAGGLFNNVYGTIRNFGLTHIHASVEGEPMSVAFGSLAIVNYGSLQRVFASGHSDLSQSQEAGNPFLGGLLAFNGGAVEDSHANINFDLAISNEHQQLIGGLVGINYGTIQRSYTEGRLGPSGNNLIGGIAGDSEGIIKNSYSLAVIDGPFGGLTALNRGKIASSYAAGRMKDIYGATGGIAGNDQTDHGGLSKCYWDLDDGVSDPAKAVGNFPDYPGGTGLTTAQLQSGLPDGFDPKIWAENPAVNNGLPYLISNPPGK